MNKVLHILNSETFQGFLLNFLGMGTLGYYCVDKIVGKMLSVKGFIH